MRHPARQLPSPADRIPMFQGRPAREYGISRDDMLNLIIALEIHPDVARFCEDIHLFSPRH